MTSKVSWLPDENTIRNSNIGQMMQKTGCKSYPEFWQWSVEHKAEFWQHTLAVLGIAFHRGYDQVLECSEGAEKARWLPGSRLNITDSCFGGSGESLAVIYKEANGSLVRVTQDELENLVNRVANGLVQSGLQEGDRVAIYMPMTLEAVAIYLGAIRAGMPVVTIADSFAVDEIAIRLDITKPRLLFTQDHMQRAGKTLPMYEKVQDASATRTVVLPSGKQLMDLREGDLRFEDFLSPDAHFESCIQDPDAAITVLFSSGTTGSPKAIPWTHTTPLKGAADGYYHHDIHEGDVVCWPTNLGWMMGPWLIFAARINKAVIALHYGAPMGEDFGAFVQDAGVTMLGVVPSIVRQWKSSGSMEKYDWSAIHCFSSTGEASNPDEMEYLMRLGGNKPVIEYCGGTEVGGGYVTSTVLQPNLPSTFSTQALGGEFVLLDPDGQPADQGEMFLIPPIMGLSATLLNGDHHAVYYEGTPQYRGGGLRRHGDVLVRLSNGYYKAQGRADDAMNLGGIKVSSLQIEELINQLDFVKESAAIAVSPQEGGPSVLVVYTVGLPSAFGEEEKLQMARSIIRNRLNPLFKVERLIEIDALPRTASGKVMRRKLRDACSL